MPNIFTIPERRRYLSKRMSQGKWLKMRKMRKSHLMKKVNQVWEPLRSPATTKSKKSLATEKGSGGPFGGALNNPLQDNHVVKVELKLLLHNTQMMAKDNFQDGHEQRFGFNWQHLPGHHFALAKYSLNSVPAQLILGLTFYRVSFLFISLKLKSKIIQIVKWTPLSMGQRSSIVKQNNTF